MLAYKLGLGATFIVMGFLVCWTNIWLIERSTPPALAVGYEKKYIQIFQHSLMSRRILIRFLLSLLFALVFGIGASGQWKNWLLFEHAVAFHKFDPIFHRDISYFIFRLPFLTFVVSWVQIIIIVSFVLALAGHILSGAIRVEQKKIKMEQRALAHISLILAGWALFRAWAYYYVDRFTLELSHDGVVAGASYVDMHVRLPADNLLAIVSLAAFVVLVVNIYHRKMALLMIAAGLWVFLVLALEVVYPAALEAFQVLPQQNTLELGSIKNNISATRYATDISGVSSLPFPANQDLNYGVVKSFANEINNVLLWDPEEIVPTLSAGGYAKNPYILTPPQVNRYVVGKSEIPVLMSVQSVDNEALVGKSWVLSHIAYSHAQGVVSVSGIGVSARGAPEVLTGTGKNGSAARLSLSGSGGEVYYSSAAPERYVIVNGPGSATSKKQAGASSVKNISYSGLGIGLGSFLVRMASAIHFDSASIMFSNLIGQNSNLIPITNVTQEMQNALPFLRVSANPYPAIAGGQLYWMDNVYATSAYYPNAQPLDSSVLPADSALRVQDNFVRDGIIAVENASTGAMNFYVTPGSDPMIKAYQEALPGVFKPIADMSAVLKQHLEYPQSLFMLQSAAYGIYHVSNPSVLYNSLKAWQIPVAPAAVLKKGKEKFPFVGETGPFEPNFEMLPFESDGHLNFDLIEPLVPYSLGAPAENLTSFLTASSSYKSFGDIYAYNVGSDRNISGPFFAVQQIMISKAMVNLAATIHKIGSNVILGKVEILPLADSLLYEEPVYISSTSSQVLRLYGVAVYYDGRVALGSGSYDAIVQLFAHTGNQTPLSSLTTISDAQKFINMAAQESAIAKSYLSRGDLGNYQLYEQKSASDVLQAKELLSKYLPVKQSTKRSSSHTHKKTLSSSVPAASVKNLFKKPVM